jgi:SAM-dependent methyltransferase
MDPRASSFGSAAALYDRVRPSYPPAALRWALAPLGPGSWRVADIGAGTGIMTRLLVESGYEAVAIEPDDKMRARLVASSASITVLPGRAESLPVPDGGLDAAVAAQAYHWFDQEVAHAELARAIRPGGVFAAIWNDRDDETGWVREYTRIIEGIRGPDHGRAVSYGDGFGPIEVERFPNPVRATPHGLVELLRSRSYYLTATPALRAELEAAVLALTREHPDLAGRDSFELPYLTAVHRAVRA